MVEESRSYLYGGYLFIYLFYFSGLRLLLYFISKTCDLYVRGIVFWGVKLRSLWTAFFSNHVHSCTVYYILKGRAMPLFLCLSKKIAFPTERNWAFPFQRNWEQLLNQTFRGSEWRRNAQFVYPICDRGMSFPLTWVMWKFLVQIFLNFQILLCYCQDGESCCFLED